MVAEILPLNERYVDQTADVLRKLAERAERGEITAFAGIIELKGGGYSQVGPGCPDRHRQAGMLLELAINRIIED
jgi:hypothetical protein